MWWAIGGILAVLALFAGPMAGTNLRALVRSQGGTLVIEDLTKLREVGYKRATELGFNDGSSAKDVLLALGRDVVGPIAVIHSVRLGTVFEDTWGHLLERVAVAGWRWSELKSIIDEEMRARGML